MPSSVRYEVTDDKGQRRGVQTASLNMVDRLTRKGWIFEPLPPQDTPSADWAAKLIASNRG